MKKFLSLSLLALSLGSAQKVSADATSYLFGGASIGWTNVIQSAESGFETTLLTEDDFIEEGPENTPIAATSTGSVNQATPLNQSFITQDLSKFTAVYPSSSVAGEIFIGGECRNDSNIFQAQVGVTWIGKGEQQNYTYNTTKQSVVNSENDTVVDKTGAKIEATSTPLVHTFNYNGADVTTNDLKIGANWGVKAMLGWGLQSGDLGLVFNVGYAGEHNTATLDYYADNLAYLSGEDEPELSTTEKKFWRHGILLGLQLIWKINPTIDALVVWQKTFYGKKTITFDDFGTSSDSDDENAASGVLGTEFMYQNTSSSMPADPTKSAVVTEESVSSEIEGNSVKTSLERTYVGFGLRFKVGSEE